MTESSAKGTSGRNSQLGAMAVVSRPSTKVSVCQTNEVEKMKNPYKMPKDSDIFKLREEEKKRKAEDRIRLRDLKVHEKTTQATRINFKTARMIKPIESDEERERDDDEIVPVKEDPEFTLAVTRDRHIEKESLNDYITKKREMFLVQYSLGVKRDEMRKLEEIASAEEKKLEQAEQYLEEDAQMFDAFLKENDTNSVNAIQKAEAETKKKLEKLSEIKRVTAQMMTIKSEISKHEETLKEYQMYKRFLESLTPPEWLELRALDRKKRVEAKRKEAAADQQERASTASSRPSSKASRQNVGSRESRRRGRGGKTSASSRRNLPAVQGEDQDTNLSLTDEDSDEEPELYFTDPQQLLDIFADLEEQNLSLIQNSQETEETLEDMKQNLARTQKNMEKETKVLQDQINKLESAIEKEDVKANDLKMKAK
ncbi:DgyrCDS10461 [Dimorphilus gyrociliatus]|nr:DgyrCDS10461 [Dimorphilus gyrociliatus]